MSRKKLLIITAGVVILAAISLIFLLDMQKQPGSTGTHTQSSQKKPTPTSAPTKPEFNKAQFSLTDPASPWVIVNKQHPLNPISYAPSDLTSVGNGQEMRAEAAQAFTRMQADAAAAGLTITPDSGYRSYNTQVSVYNGYVKSYGQAYTDTISARPGFSEHQTGWAMDVGTNGCHIDGCFASTAAGQWATANAYKYGFLLRYPDTLTPITGYSHEAWHFRYIGPILAQEMHTENSQTLEQFFGVSGGTNYL